MKLSDFIRPVSNDAYGKNYYMRYNLFRYIAAMLTYFFVDIWIYFFSKSVTALLISMVGLVIFAVLLFSSYVKYKNGRVDFTDASYQKSTIAQSEFDFLSKMNHRQYLMRLILSPVLLILVVILTSLTPLTTLIIGIGCIGGALYAARYFYMMNEQDLENAYTIVPDPPKPPENKTNDFRDDSYETFIDRFFR